MDQNCTQNSSLETTGGKSKSSSEQTRGTDEESSNDESESPAQSKRAPENESTAPSPKSPPKDPPPPAEVIDIMQTDGSEEDIAKTNVSNKTNRKKSKRQQ